MRTETKLAIILAICTAGFFAAMAPGMFRAQALIDCTDAPELDARVACYRFALR